MAYNGKKVGLMSFMIVSVLLMIVLSQPWIVDRSSYDEARAYTMGISGLLAMIVITRQVILGIRPAYTRWIKDFFRVNRLHKRLGIATLAMILLHPIATVISYGTSWIYAISLDFSSSFETRVTVGKIAFDMILVILATSILSRKILSFRKRYRIHLWSYPTYIALWLHARFTGTMIAQLPVLRGYWIVIGIILATIIAIRIAYQFGFLKIKTKILDHRMISSDVAEISLQIPRAIDYQMGQFVYIQKTQGGESHPFTILSYDAEHRVMRIAYKRFGKFTSERAAQANTFSSGSQDFCWIDGPYGTFTTEMQADKPLVCIAGGIGITPFYQLIQSQSKSDISLIYLNKTREDAVYRTDFDTMLGDHCYHILSREQQSGKSNEITGKRIDAGIMSQILGSKLHDAIFLVCGGGSVISSVSEILVSLGVSSSRIHYEPFEM